MNDQNEARYMVLWLHEEEGISYKFMAEKIGISASYLSRWINNERSFNESNLRKAVNYINTVCGGLADD